MGCQKGVLFCRIFDYRLYFICFYLIIAMGKVRKRKSLKTVNNAVAINSDAEELDVDTKESAIQTVIDQLQAANFEEKYCGLQTFAMLIESPESLQLMINRGLVEMVAPHLIDSASSVRNAAAGSLRNVSAVGLEMCDALMEHDVMTSLIFYFHQYMENWTPDPSSKSKDEDLDTFIQCTNLLLNLCESSDLAVKYLGNSKILDIFPRYLDMATFGVDIVTAVMQCLFVVVEDNPLAIEKVKNSSERRLTELLSLDNDDPSTLLIKTLAAGIIINISNGNISTLPLEIMNQIIAILAKTLSLDHRLACNQLSSNVPLSGASHKVISPKSKESLVLETQTKSIIQVLDAQQSAIEIIANICSCEDADESVEVTDSSDSDEPLDEDVCKEEGLPLPEDKLPPELLEALISLEIFDKVWARTQLPAQNVMLILKEFEGSQLIYKKLYNLQTRALLCINNMLSSLPIENLGGVNRVYKIWVDAGKLVFKQNSDNLNIVESATAVMRAALDKIKARDQIKQNESNLFIYLALSDIEIMLTGIRECQVPEIRANLIRMIGILALLLVTHLNETTTNVICTITEFIIDQAHKENEVWVVAEAIDTLVDLYSEDETDILAAKVKLVDKLMALAPILKSKARQQKKLPKEYKAVVNTANSNLPRFIKYKKARVSKL